MKRIEIREAFDLYYSSKLAGQVAKGECGIENMDAKYLAEDLIENEPELFEQKCETGSVIAVSFLFVLTLHKV